MKQLLILILLTTSFTYGQSVVAKKTNTENFIDKGVVFNNEQLDNTLKLKDSDIVPIYKGCEDKTSNFERENCLKTNLIIHTVNKFMASGAPKRAKLRRGIKRIRAIFIIDEDGKTIVKQILGEWSEIIKDEIKDALEDAPIMTPATRNNKNIPVKYSIKIPFNVK